LPGGRLANDKTLDGASPEPALSTVELLRGHPDHRHLVNGVSSNAIQALGRYLDDLLCRR
jgi:hypothetical protein